MINDLASGKHPVNIRDRDDVILVLGEAELQVDLMQGSFWADSTPSDELWLKSAATVQTSDGHVLSIVRIARSAVQSASFTTYEFDFRFPANS